MIRAAAKNHAYTTVVVSPASYDAVLEELRMGEGALSPQTRESLAAEAFAYTARYDTSIARWFAEREEDFPDLYVRAFEKVVDLPYGENPHQRAAYYEQVGARMSVLSMVRQHHGKQLSYNNLLDLDSARRVAREFAVPACVIVKHNNPCGVAIGRTAQEAYERAFATDPISAFGGIIVLNRAVDRQLAEKLNEQFIEVLFAPAYDDAALEVLTQKKNIRILEDNERRVPLAGERDIRQVLGGLLVQDGDLDARRARRHGGRHRARADRGRVGRDALRLEGRQARQVQRDRARQGPRDGRHRRGADEPRRLGAPRGREVARRLARRRGARVRRVLPVRRRARARGRGRRPGDHPAGRLDPRRRGHRGGRRGRRDDGLHAPAALQALARSGLGTACSMNQRIPAALAALLLGAGFAGACGEGDREQVDQSNPGEQLPEGSNTQVETDPGPTRPRGRGAADRHAVRGRRLTQSDGEGPDPSLTLFRGRCRAFRICPVRAANWPARMTPPGPTLRALAEPRPRRHGRLARGLVPHLGGARGGQDDPLAGLRRAGAARGPDQARRGRLPDVAADAPVGARGRPRRPAPAPRRARACARPATSRASTLTYARVAVGAAEYAKTCSPGTLVIADEAHHLGEDLAWGAGFKLAFGSARRWMLLSGTPFRSDNSAIPGVVYDGGECVPGRLVRLRGRGARRRVPAGDVRAVRRDAAVAVRRRRDRDVVRRGAHHARGGPPLPHGDLDRAARRPAADPARRAPAADRGAPGGHLDAGGLIVTADSDHARAVAKAMHEITGILPTVVLHTEASAHRKLDAFRKSAEPWIVAVNMVSEGVDIPRLRVGVYATVAKTPMIFRQIVGRFVRVIAGRPVEQSWVFLPGRPDAARAGGRHRDRAAPLACGPTRTTAPTRACSTTTCSSARTAWRPSRPAWTSSRSRAEVAPQMELFAIPGDPAPAPAASAPPPPPMPMPTPAAVGPDAAEDEPPLSAFERRAQLRKERHELVASLRRMDGRSHAEINGAVNRTLGIGSVDKATIAELEKSIELLHKELAKTAQRRRSRRAAGAAR